MYYGKGFNDGEDETSDQKLIKRIEKALKEKEDYDGGNLRAIKAAGEESEDGWGEN